MLENPVVCESSIARRDGMKSRRPTFPAIVVCNVIIVYLDSFGDRDCDDGSTNVVRRDAAKGDSIEVVVRLNLTVRRGRSEDDVLTAQVPR
jgi:hypothetical protein